MHVENTRLNYTNANGNGIIAFRNVYTTYMFTGNKNITNREWLVNREHIRSAYNYTWKRRK